MNFLVDGAMIHEADILMLYEYMDLYFTLPSPLNRPEFNKVSYARWAIDEMIGLLSDFPNIDSELIIREFAVTMRALAEKKEEESFIFEIAANTADEVLQKII